MSSQQITFSLNESNNTFKCPVSGCTKEYTKKSNLVRHIAKGKHSNQASIMTYDEQDLAEVAEPSVTIDPVVNSSNNMVFYIDETENYEGTDEENIDEAESLGQSNEYDFTESMDTNEDENEGFHDIHDNTFEGNVYRGEFYPFKDKIHMLIHRFYYKTGGDISQSLMKQILHLIEEVVEAKRDFPEAKVPAPHHIFNFDKTIRNKIPSMKLTEHEVVLNSIESNETVERVHKFTMNPPSEIMRLLVGNPESVGEISLLPDHTPGEMIESNQTDKWKYHEKFQHPMVTVTTNGIESDYWVGDLVALFGKEYILSRFFTVNHRTVMAEAFEYTERTYLHAHNPPSSFDVNNIEMILCNKPETLSMSFLPFVSQDSELLAKCGSIRARLVNSSLLKTPMDRRLYNREFMRVKVVPINLFTDDMSGNRTKKHNKFDSWILVPAAIPLKKRHQLDNTYFICTDHSLSAMQMLPAIVDDLKMLEDGVCMHDPSGEPVIVIAPLQFITADNARHAEIASSRGAISSRPCRKCNWEIKTEARQDGSDYYSSPRSEEVVRQIHERYLNAGANDKSLLIDVDRGYKLVGGQSLLRLNSFDTMLDCPIELLHTIMLGVGKALVSRMLKNHMNPEQKKHLEKFLFGYDSQGFTRKLRSSLRLHGSFLGRDYKILIQQIPIALDQLFASGKIIPSNELLAIKACFTSLGRLTSYAYISKIDSHCDLYINAIRVAVNNLRFFVHQYETLVRSVTSGRGIYQSSKMHILFHLADDIKRFGSPIFYETEKGEQFNKFIRETLFRSNRRNPSRDAAIAFGKRHMAKHILTGGIWMTLDSTIHRASENVINTHCNFLDRSRDFADNNEEEKKLKKGSTGMFENAEGFCFVGEIAKFDPLYDILTFKVFSFDVSHQGSNSYRLKKIITNTLSTSVYLHCNKDAGGNLLIKELPEMFTISSQHIRLVEIIDLSQKQGEFNLINVSKFGTLWWAQTHEIYQ